MERWACSVMQQLRRLVICRAVSRAQRGLSPKIRFLMLRRHGAVIGRGRRTTLLTLIVVAIASCASSGHPQSSSPIQFRPILSFETSPCGHNKLPPSDAVASGYLNGPALPRPMGIGWCYHVGRSWLSGDAIVKVQAAENGIYSAETRNQPGVSRWSVEIWLSDTGKAQLAELWNMCEKTTPSCPDNFSTGGFIIAIHNKIAGQIEVALGPAPSSPFWFGNMQRTEAADIVASAGTR
jgi:hypothetical protein